MVLESTRILQLPVKTAKQIYDELITASMMSPHSTQRQQNLARNFRYDEEEEELERRCAKCQDWWPATSEFFSREEEALLQLRSYCKSCDLEEVRARRKQRQQMLLEQGIVPAKVGRPRRISREEW